VEVARKRKKGEIFNTVTRTFRSFSLSGAGVAPESKKGKERLISPDTFSHKGSAPPQDTHSYVEKDGAQTVSKNGRPSLFKRALSKSSDAFPNTSKKGKEPLISLEISSQKPKSPDTCVGSAINPVLRSLDSLGGRVEKGWRPRFFHNIKHENNTSFHELVRNVALFTSAAPVYFPIAPGGFVDGSITANNPAMCAVAMSIESKITPDEIVVLSLGTGRAVHSVSISNANKDWGFSKWAFELIDIFQDSQSEVIDYQCKQILGDRYHRIQPLLPDSSFKPDKVNKIPALTKIATDFDLTETIHWLNTVWKHGDKKIVRHPDYTPNLTPTHSPSHFI